MTEDPNFENVAALARKLGKPIMVYDLEATTFRGQPNFGITEVWCFVVSTQGPGVSFGSLINPEREISREAQRVTGISQKMVENEPTWGVRFAEFFHRAASGQCYVVGFNNQTFDNPAVKDMNARYGQPIEDFELTFDIRQLHLTLSASKSKAGTLTAIANAYGVLPRGNAHRAEADVLMTLELLNQVIEVYGLEAVANLILNPPVGAKTKLSALAIAKYVKNKKKVSVTGLMDVFKKPRHEVSFEVSKAIDERLVDPLMFEDPRAQAWLDQALASVPVHLLEEGKLKPLFDALSDEGAPPSVDYVQLRISLLQAGLSWASLKPN